MTSLLQRKRECYAFILGMMMPPRPMTAAEYGEWWLDERQPLIEQAGLTVEEACAALRVLAKVARGKSS